MRGGTAYISGALTGLSDPVSARRYYELLATVCQEAGMAAYLPHRENDPVLHADVPASVVYQRDLVHLQASDVVVAHVGAPSLGVGAELALAVAAGIDIVAVRRPAEPHSRFVAGMLEEGGAHFIVASDIDLPTELLRAILGV